jgi:hypothetical protein
VKETDDKRDRPKDDRLRDRGSDYATSGLNEKPRTVSDVSSKEKHSDQARRVEETDRDTNSRTKRISSLDSEDKGSHRRDDLAPRASSRDRREPTRNSSGPSPDSVERSSGRKVTVLADTSSIKSKEPKKAADSDDLKRSSEKRSRSQIRHSSDDDRADTTIRSVRTTSRRRRD